MQRWLTIFGLIVFGAGVWLSLTLLNLEVEAVFDSITTDKTYTFLRGPSWDGDRITADLFEISMQDTSVKAISMDITGGDIWQKPQEPKAVPPEAQTGDSLPSPDGAHILTISGERGKPTIRLNDSDIAPGLDPAWSPDSARFAFVNSDGEIRVYDVAEAQLGTIYPPLEIACPPPVIPAITRITVPVTNRLERPLTVSLEASTTPPISINPRSQDIALPANTSQPLTWDARATSADRYQFEINVTAGSFSTLRTCQMVVTPPLLGDIGLTGGHALAAGFMAAGFALMLPRIVTRKYLWSKIVSAAPFLAILAFQIAWVARLL